MSRILLCQDCRPQRCEVLTIGLGGILECRICGAKGTQGGGATGLLELSKGAKVNDIEAVSLSTYRRDIIRKTNAAQDLVSALDEIRNPWQRSVRE